MRVSLRAITITLLVLILITVSCSVASYVSFAVVYGVDALGDGEALWCVLGGFVSVVLWANIADECLRSNRTFGIRKTPSAKVVKR